MKFRSINFKIQTVLVFTFIISIAGIIFVANTQFYKIVDDNQLKVYNEKLDAILGLIQRNYDKLQETLMIEAYEDDFKAEVANIIRKDYYQTENIIYPFIIDHRGIVVVHPDLPEGTDVWKLEFIKDIVKTGNGNFNYIYKDVEKWMSFKHFAGWDWFIGFAVPLEIKYAEVKRFRLMLVTIMFAIAGIAMLLSSFIISQFIKPIVELTKVSSEIAAGNLEQEIDIQGDDEIGVLSHSFINMRDAIKQQLTELEQHQNKLEKMVAERTSKLAQTQQQLIHSEKLAAIGQLAAGVAHEINNPLGFISGNMGILQKYFDSYNDYIELCQKLKESVHSDQQVSQEITDQIEAIDATGEFAHMIEDLPSLINESKDGLERIRKIVLDLRTFARNEDAETSECDLHTIIDSAIGIVWNEIKYKAELIKEYGQLPLIHCNEQRLVQVFMNLLVNAVHSIDTKGKITVKTDADEQNVYAVITDTGKGIAPEDKKHIFNPFFTTKPPGEGTGLGLSIIYDILKQHNGDIKVDSKLGEGTSITVILPI